MLHLLRLQQGKASNQLEETPGTSITDEKENRFVLEVIVFYLRE